jgi:hypothetical protein
MSARSELVLDLYVKMSNQQIISAFHGQFTQAVIDMLLKQAKWDLTTRNVDKLILKKTYSILVECLENILKHKSIFKIKPKSDGIVVLGNSNDTYYVTVGNIIDNSEVPNLKVKLDEINSMDKEQLKEKHKQILTNGHISDRGGAGLGILEIAMKSGNRLDYEFTRYDDNLTFFALQVIIGNN